MKGVKFEDYHSYLDFGLILSSYSVGDAKPKTEMIDIPGSDGSLDLSEYFGDIKYKNRKLSFTFSTIGKPSEFLQNYSRVQNLVNGRKMKIVLDDDPEFYYVGRVTVDEWKSKPRVGSITIDCDCEPYKYKIHETVVANKISGSETIIYDNLRKWVTPVFAVTAPVTIAFGGIFVELDSGEYTVPAIEFKQGQNIVTYTGDTVVTVKYQEGGL